jgi:hypothetical protein
VANSTVRCTSRSEAAGADLGGVGAGVGERGVAGGAPGRGLASVGSGGLAGVDGEPGAEVDELGEDELLAPPAPSKWM